MGTERQSRRSHFYYYVIADLILGTKQTLLPEILIFSLQFSLQSIHNRKSTIIEMLPEIATDALLGVREHLLKRIEKAGTNLILNAKIKEFLDDGVIYEQNGEEKKATGFDDIILALGVESVNTLEKELEGLVPEIYVIGDAKQVGHANDATEAAIEVAHKL